MKTSLKSSTVALVALVAVSLAGLADARSKGGFGGSSSSKGSMSRSSRPSFSSSSFRKGSSSSSFNRSSSSFKPSTRMSPSVSSKPSSSRFTPSSSRVSTPRITKPQFGSKMPSVKPTITPRPSFTKPSINPRPSFPGIVNKPGGFPKPTKPGIQLPGKPTTGKPTFPVIGKPGIQLPGKPATGKPTFPGIGKPGVLRPGLPGIVKPGPKPGMPGIVKPGIPGIHKPGKPNGPVVGKPAFCWDGRPGNHCKPDWHNKPCLPRHDWCHTRPRHCHWWFDFRQPIRHCRPVDCHVYAWDYVTCGYTVPGTTVVVEARWYLGLSGILLPGKGMGIDAVEAGSPAAAAGLAPGMVIVQCNGLDIVDETSMPTAIEQSGGVLNMIVLDTADGTPAEVTVVMQRLVAQSF